MGKNRRDHMGNNSPSGLFLLQKTDKRSCAMTERIYLLTRHIPIGIIG